MSGIGTIALPQRANALSYPAESVAEVARLLNLAPSGQGVAIDEPQDSITKARSRASVMREAVQAAHNIPCHGHAIPTGNTVDRPVMKDGKPTGKTEKVKTYVPALSVNQTKLRAQRKAEAEAGNGNGAAAAA